MSEQLDKAEAEISKLQRELDMANECSSSSDASSTIAEFITSNEEPFLQDYSGQNQWHQAAGGGGGCILS